MVAPKRYRAAIAFTTGWLSSFGWLFTTASANLFCAQICVNIATLYHPTYVWRQWQVWLIYTLVIIICALITIYLPRLIPIGETFFFWTSVVDFVDSFIALLAASNTKQSGRAVFTDRVNQTGWSDGVAFLLAVGQSMYGFLCTDAATHLSEEMPVPVPS